MINLREWFDLACFWGPKSGYVPDPPKSILIVKEGLEELAKEIFAGTGVNIVSGSRYLGGCIGEKEVVHDFVKDKVGKWVDSINNLTKAAHKYPQAVHSCFTKSLQCEWNYLQRVVPGCDDLYEELKTTINQVLIPAIFGREVLQREYELLELPVRIGGMALKDPVKTASTNFNNSSNATVIMQHAIKTGDKP